MKKNVLTLFLIIIGHNLYAQNLRFDKPDYNKIKSIISNKESDYGYQRLLKRYNNFDTTLTIKDFELLYYGYIYQDSYSPFKRSPYSDSLYKVYFRGDLLDSDYDKMIKYEKSILTDLPFEIRDMQILASAYHEKGYLDSAKMINFKLDNILKVIENTGDGLTEQTAWHIISKRHEWFFMYIHGFMFAKEQYTSINGYDCLKVMVNDKGVNTVYFDINKIMDAECRLRK